MAEKLKCFIVFGFIEQTEEEKDQIKLYNSAAVIDRQGTFVKNYRKCHLYYNDKNWAESGDSFVNF